MRVRNGGLVDGEHGAFCACFEVIGLRTTVGCCRDRTSNVNTPSAACAFDVKSLAYDTYLAPRIPVRRDEDFVPVEYIVLESLLLELGMYA